LWGAAIPCVGSAQPAAAANVLDLMIGPGPVRDAVVNWHSVVPELLERCRREAVGGVVDPETSERLQAFRSRRDVAELIERAAGSTASVPVIDVAFAFGADRLSFFSVVSTIGTPADITAQELRVEAFFPSDAATHEAWTRGSREPRFRHRVRRSSLHHRDNHRVRLARGSSFPRRELSARIVGCILEQGLGFVPNLAAPRRWPSRRARRAPGTHAYQQSGAATPRARATPEAWRCSGELPPRGLRASRRSRP
jgi:hypothetical protein